VQGAERFLLLGVDGQYGDSALACQASKGGNVTKLAITRLRVDLSGDRFFTPCPATKAGLIKQSGGGIATDFNAALKQALRQLHWLEVLRRSAFCESVDQAMCHMNITTCGACKARGANDRA
jgi:hypothetical protein